MRTPMQARYTIVRATLVAAALLVGACRGDIAAPKGQLKSTEGVSAFVPTAAQRALVGIEDGTYQVDVNPKKDQLFEVSGNRLVIPKGAICDLQSSGYGPGTWDLPCTPETKPLTLTITIKGAKTEHPLIDFAPAMRFNPAKVVSLYMYVPAVQADDAKNWLMLYCTTGVGANCTNEQLTDASLTTYVDYTKSVLFRRIKHFSGYLGTGREESCDPNTDPNCTTAPQ